MQKISISNLLSTLFLVMVICQNGWAQTTVSGAITDEASGEGLAGVNIVVKGTVQGTITDIQGNFNLSISNAPPITLIISYIGYQTQEVAITDSNTSGLALQMAEQTLLGQEIVVSASRVEESIVQSPVTIEKLDILAIQQSTAPNFYDQLAFVKGVQSSSSSLTFNAINTRGFATIANTRFVALVDGMDISAPLLNFPTGNLVGISELDVESVELVPGAASALYGPNAFNGILFMNGKSPFEYQGLSATAKIGSTDSEASDANPLYKFALRYAKSFNNKFAFKVNFSILDATDWAGNDYTHDRISPFRQPGDANFDGLNLYGDETPINFSLGPFIAPIDARRTGIREEDLLDTQDARSLKFDAAAHYRINDKMEAIYNFRFGGGRSIYQGSAKFVLRDFTQQFHKLELKGDNFFVRAYRTETDDGDSYNLDAMGGLVNEAFSPTAAQWAPAYIQAVVLALQGFAPGIPAGNRAAADAYGRTVADANIPAIGSTQWNQTIESVRTANFQRTPPGAGFIEGSKLWHSEFNYNFKDMIDVVEIQLGGNVRRYDIFSDGTIFDEEQNPDGSHESVIIDEWGIYTQLSKSINNLKLAGSIRFDKNENFEGQINPRISAVYTLQENHNFRASFQTGFRNPDSQSQFIWFPTPAGVLVGSTEANASRYGIHNGGAWTATSVAAFLGGGGSFDQATGNPIGGNSAILQTSNFDYVQPEKLQAIEVGYKGIIAGKLLLDINYYHNSYDDFIAQQTVFNKVPVMRRGQVVTGTTGDAITGFRPYINAQETVSSDGIGVGLTYNLGQGFTLAGNYNWADFTINDADASSDFQAGFNTPNHRYTLTFGNRDVGEGFGFNMAFRWQDDFIWESAFGTGDIPDYGIFDMQVNYKIKAIKSIIKVGGTNLLGGDYRSNVGGGFVGSQYYLALTFDEFLN